ncbi:MAG: hypothetical protein ACKVHB_08010 [Pseudomonadales bacterium]
MRDAHWPQGITPIQIKTKMRGIAVGNLPRISAFEESAIEKCDLNRRPLDPWRPILAVSLWLEEELQVEGLFARMNRLAHQYNQQRVGELEGGSQIQVVLQSIALLASKREGDLIIFSSTDLQHEMEHVLQTEGLSKVNDNYLNVSKIGKLLSQLRISASQRTSSNKMREITRLNLKDLMRNYGISEIELPK